MGVTWESPGLSIRNSWVSGQAFCLALGLSGNHLERETGQRGDKAPRLGLLSGSHQGRAGRAPRPHPIPHTHTAPEASGRHPWSANLVLPDEPE